MAKLDEKVIARWIVALVTAAAATVVELPNWWNKPPHSLGSREVTSSEWSLHRARADAAVALTYFTLPHWNQDPEPKPEPEPEPKPDETPVPNPLVIEPEVPAVPPKDEPEPFNPAPLFPKPLPIPPDEPEKVFVPVVPSLEIEPNQAQSSQSEEPFTLPRDQYTWHLLLVVNDATYDDKQRDLIDLIRKDPALRWWWKQANGEVVLPEHGERYRMLRKLIPGPCPLLCLFRQGDVINLAEFGAADIPVDAKLLVSKLQAAVKNAPPYKVRKVGQTTITKRPVVAARRIIAPRTYLPFSSNQSFSVGGAGCSGGT